MKIVLLEREVLGYDLDLSRFRELGEVIEYNNSTNEQIAERIGDADCVIVNKLKMDEEHRNSCTNLKLILEAATGTDNIDMNYCTDRGIVVKNVKGYSTSAVAAHTFALYFYLCEHLPYYDNFVKCGEWSKSGIFSKFEPYFDDLEGKTWGVMGMGAIGQRVAKIAAAFGAKVITYSVSGGDYSAFGYEQPALKDFLKNSDVISIHTPLTEKSINFFNKDIISQMKPTAFLINVARGAIVSDPCYFTRV